MLRPRGDVMCHVGSERAKRGRGCRGGGTGDPAPGAELGTPPRLRLAMQVSTGIAAQTPRRWETSPRRGHLPGLAQMRIWQNRDGIETSPLPADPRVFPATPSHAGNKKRYARVSSIFLSRPLSLALPRGAAAASPSRFLAALPVS
jgi:hypothetical protein